MINILSNKKRYYRIEVYSLYDIYLGTLCSYKDSLNGMITEPVLTVSQDGSQSFSCSIPKYYIEQKSNKKIINPRWEDDSGILAENARILKIFIKYNDNDEEQVFPMIIDSISDSRDKHFEIQKQITASGLAFSELGKLGYKIEFSETTIEKDEATETPIQYWLDKVFSNEKDTGGKIIKWLTPWCYEIRMNWDHVAVPPGAVLDKTKIYDEQYITSWEEDANGNLIATGISPWQEKSRQVDVSGSNKYNITQTLAEQFGVYCTYEYKVDAQGYFKREYIDENGQLWTGKKVIFYNQAIHLNNPLIVEYEKNLNSITRTKDTTEFYTKLYVTPLDSAEMNSGLVSIAETEANPLLQDFILNFDFLENQNALTSYQKEAIKQYSTKVHKISKELKDMTPDLMGLEANVNEAKGKLTMLEAQKAEAQKQLEEYKQKRDEYQGEYSQITYGKNNPTSLVFVAAGRDLFKAAVHFEGTQFKDFRIYNSRECNKNTWRYPAYSKSNPVVSPDDEEKETSTYLDKWYIKIKKVEDIPKNALKEITVAEGEDYQTELDNIDPNYERAKFYFLMSEDDCITDVYVSKYNRLKAGSGEDKSIKISPGTQYATLTYNPYNKYKNLCDEYEILIETLEDQIEQTKEEQKILQKQYDEKTERRVELENTLDSEHIKFEYILGPALREGYWLPDENYKTVGQIFDEHIGDAKTNIKFIWDEEPFDNEQLYYYYTNIGDVTSGENSEKYKAFFLDEDMRDNINANINILDKFYIKADQSISFITNLKEINSQFTWLSFHYENTTYYYEIPQGDNFEFPFYTKDADETNIRLEFNALSKHLSLIRNNEIQSFKNKIVDKPPQNCLNLSNGIPESRLQPHYFYEKSSFIFTFVKTSNGTVNPAVMFISKIANNVLSEWKNDESDFTLSYGFKDTEHLNDLKINKSNIIDWETNESKLVYPRIYINKENVNFDSDLFKVNSYIITEETEPDTQEKIKQYTELVRHADYYVLSRQGKPYITLRLSKNNSITNITSEQYKVYYKISQANEQLYLDAKEVARDNAYPKYSYELSVANLPDLSIPLQLGQLVYINDSALGVYAANGYISDFNLVLDKPSEDGITIQNYKTKFEDLFSTITASSEAMKNNRIIYDTAANSIANMLSPTGIINGTILQNSIANNNISFNYSNTHVKIGDKDGIILTNESPYANGVFGQVALRGGGIFFSHDIDTNGNRIWNAAITPLGINASYLIAGQIDANQIQIFSGPNKAFQWNSSGIYAYAPGANEGTYDNNTYVRYSHDGLEYIKKNSEGEEETNVQLGWQGLSIAAQSSSLIITGGNGLEVFDNNQVRRLQLGRFTEISSNGDNSVEYYNEYGLKLFKSVETLDNNENKSYQSVPTLITKTDGTLWLQDELIVGLNGGNAGISGQVSSTEMNQNNSKPSTDVRFWAGAPADQKETAPFRVLDDGTVIASKMEIGVKGLYRIEINPPVLELITPDIVSTIFDELRPEASSPNTSDDGTDEAQIVNELAESDDKGENNTDDSSEINNVFFRNSSLIWNIFDNSNNEFTCVLENNTEESRIKLQTFGEDLDIYVGLTFSNVMSTTVNFDTFISDNNELLYVDDDRTQIKGIDLNQILLRWLKNENTSSVFDPTSLSFYLYKKTADDTIEIITTEIVYIGVNNSLSELSVLASIENGEVTIAEGKVTANSIVAGAITTDKLSGNSLQSMSKLEFPTTEDNQPIYTYTAQGALINLSNGGSLHFQNFYIDDSGNAGLRGEIEARRGTIGGWEINENTITNLTSSAYVGLSSQTVSGKDSIRFFAGAYLDSNNEINMANAPFSVTAGGHLKADSAEIKGQITAESGEIKKLVIGSTDNNNKYIQLINNTTESYIGSSDYIPEISGWRIFNNGRAEFADATIRGTLTSVIFKRKLDSVVGGKIHVAPTIQIVESKEVKHDNTDYYIQLNESEINEKLLLKILPNETLSSETNTTIRLTRTISGVFNGKIQINLSTENNRKIDINVEFKTANITIVKETQQITNDQTGASEAIQQYFICFSQDTINSYLPDSLLEETLPEGTSYELTSVAADSFIVLTGTENILGSIILDAEGENGPYLHVYEPNQTLNNNNTRLGALEGIDDLEFGGKLTGYGLYTQNAYLKGSLILPNAGITNQSEIGVKVTEKNEFVYASVTKDPDSTSYSPIRIWAGGAYPKVLSESDSINNFANFIVTEDGYLYASAGYFKGFIHADSGIFNGELQAAKIIIDKDENSEHNHFYIGYQAQDSDSDPRDQYILNIDKVGLSLYEGGIFAYSDLASGWNEKGLKFSPYNYYSTEDKKYLPYFYLTDKIQLNNEANKINDITSRWVAANGHIFKVMPVEAKNATYSYTSVKLNNKIEFNQGEIDLSDINNPYTDANWQSIEHKIFEEQDNLYSIGLNNSNSALEFQGNHFLFGFDSNDSFNTSSTVAIKNSLLINSDNTTATLSINNVTITDAIYDSKKCGINFITS